MSAETVLPILWAVWYATWLAAVVFSGRTTVQMGKGESMGGLHRAVVGVGALLLFMPERWAGPAGGALWPEPAAVKWALLILVVAAFGFCWWARLHLGRLWSGFVTLKEDHRIVDTGPYGLVRHPIYTGAIFAGVITALIKATPVALVGAALIGVGFWLTGRIEEGFLRAQLGAETYDAYSRRVPMLIPKLI